MSGVKGCAGFQTGTFGSFTAAFQKPGFLAVREFADFRGGNDVSLIVLWHFSD